MNRGKLKKVSIYVAAILGTLMLVFFILRNVILSFYLERKISIFNKEYHAILKVDKARIRNVSDILLTGISLKPENGDTLLAIDSAYASLNFWKLIFGRIVLHNLELSKTLLSLKQVDSLTNYRFMLRDRNKKNKEDYIPNNYTKCTLNSDIKGNM